MANIASCLLINVLIIAFLTSRISCQNSTLCNPITNCEEEGVPGIKVPDPTDCHNYYICVEGLDEEGNTVILPTDQPITCPEGDYFHVDITDQSLSNCQNENTTCVNVCANHQCQAYCIEDLDVLAAPHNCSFYYFCVPDTDPVPVLCTADLPYFDGIECSDNPFQCCDVCTPYCTKAFVEIPDPYDCTNYYLCTEASSVPTDLYSCRVNEYFDPMTGFCQESGTEQCQPLC